MAAKKNNKAETKKMSDKEDKNTEDNKKVESEKKTEEVPKKETQKKVKDTKVAEEKNNKKVEDESKKEKSDKVKKVEDKPEKSRKLEKPEDKAVRSVFARELENFENLHKKLLDEGFTISHIEDNKNEGFNIQASKKEDKHEENYGKNVKIGKNSYFCSESYSKVTRS